MIDRNDDLPMSRQAKVLGISRSSVYYLPRPVSADDLALMRRIDELHLDYPFAGPNSPASPSPACCSRTRSRSAWMGKAAGYNVFVERLWRTIKYEEVYLRAYASVPEARASIGR